MVEFDSFHHGMEYAKVDEERKRKLALSRVCLATLTTAAGAEFLFCLINTGSLKIINEPLQAPLIASGVILGMRGMVYRLRADRLQEELDNIPTPQQQQVKS